MLVISTTEFRDKQKSYLDKIDSGIEILIHRSKDKSYKIVPVSEYDTVINPDYILSPNADLARAITAEELLAGVKTDLKEIFENKKK